MHFDEAGVSVEVSDRELVDAVLTNRSADGLRELMRRETSDLAPALSAVLADPDQPPHMRASAAVGLGRRPAREHQNSLVAALGDPEPAVSRRAAEALGRIGDERALDALLEQVPASRAVERSRHFARTLIAYRLGLDRQRLPEPSPEQLLEITPGAAIPLTVNDGPPDLSSMQNTLRRRVPGVELSIEAPLTLACASDTFVVLTAEAPAPASRHRSTVLGAVLELLPGAREIGAFLYLLSHPRPDGTLALFGLYDGGPVALAGSLRPDERSAAFELRATREWTAPPVLVTGTYHRPLPRIRLTLALIDQALTDEQRRGIRQPRWTPAPKARLRRE
jgi:HEAT repeats